MEKSRTAAPSGFGELLRRWRERRRLSQLDLATDAEISTRHLSFIETGRAQPSREMVLLLARALDFILRQQEPYPALVLDRHWNVLEVNAGSARFQRAFLDPEAVAALGAPNAMRLMFHPQARWTSTPRRRRSSRSSSARTTSRCRSCGSNRSSPPTRPPKRCPARSPAPDETSGRRPAPACFVGDTACPPSRKSPSGNVSRLWHAPC